ncbi:MAG: hypothetical protein AAF790_09340 [Planctomycetota bacterium]
MVSSWKPLATLTCLIALFAWVATTTPAGAPVAAADPGPERSGQGSLGLDRLRGPEQFVSLLPDDEEEDGEGETEDDRWREESEEEEDWGEEFERELGYLEMRQAELQATFGDLELMQQVANMAKDPETTAVLAVLATVEEIDEPDDKVAFLKACLDRTKSAAVKRVVQLQLAEVYGRTDRGELAIELVLELAEAE